MPVTVAEEQSGEGDASTSVMEKANCIEEPKEDEKMVSTPVDVAAATEKEEVVEHIHADEHIVIHSSSSSPSTSQFLAPHPPEHNKRQRKKLKAEVRPRSAVAGLKGGEDVCLSRSSSVSNSSSSESSGETTKEIVGCLNLIRVELPAGLLATKKQVQKCRSSIARLEKRVQKFFISLAYDLEEIDGVDLTDRGDGLIGNALCKFAAGAEDDLEHGKKKKKRDRKDAEEEDDSDSEDEDHDFKPYSGSSSSEDDDFSSSSEDDGTCPREREEDNDSYDKMVVVDSSSAASSEDEADAPKEEDNMEQETTKDQVQE